jgi:hypothetical protein
MTRPTTVPTPQQAQAYWRLPVQTPEVFQPWMTERATKERS